jgi:hypothetical protein
LGVGITMTVEDRIKAFNRIPQLLAYDISASFGDASVGRTRKRLTNEAGESHLDEHAWEAGEVAFQCLQQLYDSEFTRKDYCEVAQDFYLMVCEDVYPEILKLAESGRVDIQPNGVEGLKEAWDQYGWCDRIIFAFDFIDGLNAPINNPLNTVLPLAILARLDSAVISESLNEHGLADAMVEVTKLQYRLQPPKHVQAAFKHLQDKVDTFEQARRKGADALHAGSRAMKAEVFAWLDSQPAFESIESAAAAIVKQQPIRHGTGRNWYKQWKQQRSGSTP